MPRPAASNKSGPAATSWFFRLRFPLLFALLVLSVDDRYPGVVADGRQMIFTAVAITETASIGQARHRDLTVTRATGDAVSRYGIAMSLAQVPAAWLSPLVERRLGRGTSQPLFLIAPMLFVAAAAWIASRTALDLGGSTAAATMATLLASVASPFWSYAAMELSESLQGLALVGICWSAIKALRQESAGEWRHAAMAGAWWSVATLTKSNLLIVGPLAAIPLLRSREWRRQCTLFLAGAGPGLLAWLWLEIARFGRPFAGYAGEGFTHPLFDGAWRLLVGVNKGLLLYFPATILAGVWAFRSGRETRFARLAIVLPAVALWAFAAPWWAWHGVDGWGPRLLVPAVPLLAAGAALEMQRWPAATRTALVAVSILINLPPALVHPTPVVRYVWACAWPSAGDELTRVPPFARQQVDGRAVYPPDQILSRTASASPFLLLPWFSRASSGDPAAVAAKLDAPLWLDAQPGIRPSPPLSAEEAARLAAPPRFNLWGRAFGAAASDQKFAVYDAALANQVFRAQELGQRDQSLALAQKLETLAPDGLADALLLESYRLLSRKADAIDLLGSLPLERRRHPGINVVLALWDRDEGKEQEARALLRSSASSYPGMPAATAADRPLATWPKTFAEMTSNPSLSLHVAGS